MFFSQVLVSGELGGAGIIALRIADELHRRSQPSRVGVPGRGADMREALRLGLDVQCYDAGLISGSQSRLQAAIANLNFCGKLGHG